MAEGVESSEQVVWLVSHGCRFLQGYHFSRPVPLDRFMAVTDTCFAIPVALGRPYRSEPVELSTEAAD